MRHRATASFWSSLETLPTPVQKLAAKQFAILKSNPRHPSLHFKEIHDGLWSVRINREYRALAEADGDDLYWFWAGSHADYDRMIG